METQSRTGSLSSGAYPRWVMFKQFLEIKVENSSSCSPADDAKTLAAARTSAGHQIQVSLRIAEPPALSRVYLQIPDGLKGEKSKVLAAHGDSVLIQVRLREKNQQYDTFEHFVYNAGAAAAHPPRPPSLLLLPPFFGDSGSEPGELCHYSTGLLRRGEDELVVAALTVGELRPTVITLYRFRSGEWTRCGIEKREGWHFPLLGWHTVVPINDRLLCWVAFYHGIVVLDVFEETPRAQYLRLPMDLRGGSKSSQNLCATAGGSTLKLVNIFPRCCCGGTGASECKRSHHAYTIQTWILRMDGDMEWVMDGMVDATELWALDAYKANGLPCVPLGQPVVSTEEPEVICFSLCKPLIWPIWHIMLNMRSKTIHSVYCHNNRSCDSDTRGNKLIASNVSHFFNTYSSSDGGVATLTGPIQVHIKRPLAVVDDSSNPTLRQPSTTLADPASVEAVFLEMSEALQEIPTYGLLGPDEVKAYRILVCGDNCHKLRSFLRLPKDLRKDWLLMEIKTCDAS